MLEGLFDEEITYYDAPISSSNKKGTNCADSLTEPELKRSSSNFVGLYNQGGTCYMNSSLQILYMTPKFRNLINSLFLCDKILGNPTEFIPQGQKYNIILSLQKLFSELNLLNIKATKTKELTEAFGWGASEGGDQHDSQEFIRILLFDVLERILYDTPFNNIINNIYKVNYISNMKCSQCGNINTKIESEYVLNLQILNMKNINESLYSSFGLEEIIEDYNCEKCQKKVNIKKWSKIISLPNYINFGLNRFIYDYNTLERVKLNNKFEFPLEINMKEFCDFEEKNINEDEYIYELYGVIVHSGTPYSGHYYAYIRDMTGQGKWEIKKEIKENNANINNNPNKNEQELMEKEEKKINEIKENKEEENNNKDNNNEEEKKDNNNEIENNNDNENKNKKKGKRNKKEKKNNMNQKIARMKDGSKKNKDNKDKNKSSTVTDIEDPDKDFSIPYTNKSLKENWFEFNDTSVTSMPISRIEKAFKGKASAYMLFYSKKDISQEKTELLPPPDYLKDFMNEFNQNLEKERIHYEEEKNSFIVTIYEEKMFKLNKEDQIISLINNDKDNNKFLIEKKYKFNDKVSILFQNDINKNKICFLFYFINKNEEKLLIIEKKIINEEMGELTLKDIGLYHYCNIVFCDKESEIFDLNIIKIGKEYEPVNLKFFYNGNIFELKTFGCYNITELKKILENKIKLKSDNFEICFMSGNKQIILKDDVLKNKLNNNEKNIKELNLEKKNILTIIPNDKSLLEQNNENQNDNININNNQDNMINCIVKFEDDESTVEIVKINLDKTFCDLYEIIYNQFPIIKEKTENKDEQEKENKDKNFQFRLFNELDNKIISRESFQKKLITSPAFVEGDVRLKIELGEIYNENEISLTIIMKSPYEENKQIEREFICDPQKYTLYQIKKFLLDNFITETSTKSNEEKEKIYDNYLLYRVNIYNLPTKPYKNEKETVSIVGIKDRDALYLQNISEIPNEIGYINIYFSDKEANYYDLIDKFEPISFENKKRLEMKLPKKTTILELKTKINNNISPNLLLIRVIGKNNQLERVLKNDNYDLKKYNLESPINLFVEELKEPLFNSDNKNNEENNNNDINDKNKNKKNKKIINNKDNETMIILMQKNKKENKYENKKVIIIQNDPNIFRTKELYDICRFHSNWMNISIAKYNRAIYDYEEIQEYDENNNPLSLKKGNYSLRDSDWIAIKNLDEDNNEFKTTFDIEKQNEIKKKKEEMKKLKLKEKSAKMKYEKPLRIKIDD